MAETERAYATLGERRTVQVDAYIPPHVTPPDTPLPFFRAIATILDNPIEVWPRAVYEEKFWRPPSLGIPGWRYIYLTDPDGIRDLLLDRQADFDKGDILRRMLRPILGDAILTAEGAQWRWQRQAAAPAFRHERLLALTPIIARAAEKIVEAWRDGSNSAPRDINADMVRATFDVILDTMLSGGEGLDIEEASREITAYLETIGKPSVADIFGFPQWLRTAMQPRGARATRYLRNAVDDLIARRRAAGGQHDDLVAMLMNAVDPETGRQMSDEDLRDNLLTFIAAGHETTALALTWTLFLVSQHAETETRLLEEVQRIAGDAPIGAEHVEGLSFTKQVVQEAMRLYPPVAMLPRAALRDTKLGDEAIEEGTVILVPLYALHRHRRLWDNPDAFDPDRFSPERSIGRHRFAYLPFGGGQRICIGMSFAMIEAVVMLATFVRSARFRHDPAHSIRPLIRITMRPEGGMPMVVSPR